MLKAQIYSDKGQYRENNEDTGQSTTGIPN